LGRSHARNLELLAEMLLKTGSGGAADARVADAIQLGGPEAKALLERLVEDHEELKELMKSFEVIKKWEVP
jgi:hypothetical protein